MPDNKQNRSRGEKLEHASYADLSVQWVSAECPCCGNYTHDSDNYLFEICDVCYWQYDEVGHEKPDVAVGGPNRDVSLRHAQENYKRFGAYHKELNQYVREPTNEEKIQIIKKEN